MSASPTPLAIRASSGGIPVQGFFTYGPWHALLKKAEPGEHGGAEASYVGPILHQEKCVGQFRLRLSCKVEKHPRKVFLEAFKMHAEERLGMRISTKDVERFDFLDRVARDFSLHRLEGGTIAEWLERHGLKPVTRHWPMPGPEDPLLIKLGSKWYFLPQSSFFAANRQALRNEGR